MPAGRCRWGYETLDEVKDVVAQYAANSIPLETMWTGPGPLAAQAVIPFRGPP